MMTPPKMTPPMMTPPMMTPPNSPASIDPSELTPLRRKSPEKANPPSPRFEHGGRDGGVAPDPLCADTDTAEDHAPHQRQLRRQECAEATHSDSACRFDHGRIDAVQVDDGATQDGQDGQDRQDRQDREEGNYRHTGRHRARFLIETYAAFKFWIPSTTLSRASGNSNLTLLPKWELWSQTRTFKGRIKERSAPSHRPEDE